MHESKNSRNMKFLEIYKDAVCCTLEALESVFEHQVPLHCGPQRRAEQQQDRGESQPSSSPPSPDGQPKQEQPQGGHPAPEQAQALGTVAVQNHIEVGRVDRVTRDFVCRALERSLRRRERRPEAEDEARRRRCKVA